MTDVLQQRDKLHRLTRLLPRLGKLMLLTGALRAVFSLVIVLATLYYVESSLVGSPKAMIYLVAFVVSVVLLSVFAVAIPVSWARYRRELLLAWSGPILLTLLAGTYPVVWLLELFDPVVRRISGADLTPEDENAISEEVLSVVEDHQGAAVVDEAQKEMLEAVFDLPTTTAGEIMTPRTDVTGIDAGWTLSQVTEAIIECGHSRLPVYEENLDNILGMLYAKDLIAYVDKPDDSQKFDLRTVLRDAFMVPESKSVRELLAEFKARKVHIAVVLDEYGGTAGLVTIEDILEELVGEIQDEYELLEELPTIKTLDENTIEVDARLHIDDFNDHFNVELSEDEDYDTLGGFVFATLGHIPDTGESFETDNLRFTVTAAERTKVRRVKVERLSPTTAPGNHGNGSSAA